MAKQARPGHRGGEPRATSPVHVLAGELKRAAERLVAVLVPEGCRVADAVARVVEKLERGRRSKAEDERRGNDPQAVPDDLPPAPKRNRAVADLLAKLERLPEEDYRELMTALARTNDRHGFTVVHAEAMVARMCDIVVQFRFMPSMFWDGPEAVQREVQAFVELLEKDRSEGLTTLAQGFMGLLHLLAHVESRYGGFVDHTEPAKIALLAQIHQEVKGLKRRRWRQVYDRWTKLEPRLKRWCKNSEVLRVNYHQAIKDHRFPP